MAFVPALERPGASVVFRNVNDGAILAISLDSSALWMNSPIAVCGK